MKVRHGLTYVDYQRITYYKDRPFFLIEPQSMNLDEKRRQLIERVRGFLNGVISTDELNDFVWSIIDLFSDLPKENLPSEIALEREFWYAIWQIQHLVGEPDVNGGAIRQELQRIVSFLNGEIPLPDSYEGKRPSPSNPK